MGAIVRERSVLRGLRACGYNADDFYAEEGLVEGIQRLQAAGLRGLQKIRVGGDENGGIRFDAQCRSQLECIESLQPMLLNKQSGVID